MPLHFQSIKSKPKLEDKILIILTYYNDKEWAMKHKRNSIFKKNKNWKIKKKLISSLLAQRNF